MSTETHQIIFKSDITDAIAAERRLTEAFQREMQAVKTGDALKIKSAIEARKIIEGEIRQSTVRLVADKQKEVQDFITGEQKKRAEFRKSIQEMQSAPRTNIKGSIGSESYVRQLQGVQSGMLPGSNEFTQTGVLIEGYKSKLKAAGVEVTSLSQKIGGEFKGALNSTVSSIQNNIQSLTKFSLLGVGVLAGLKEGFSLLKQEAKNEDISATLKSTKENLLDFKVAAANTITDTELLPMVRYAESLKMTTEQTKTAIEQARVLARVGNQDLATSFNAIVKGEYGYLKSIATLKLSKIEYGKILADEVEKMHGTMSAEEDANGETKFTIKNLTALQDRQVRSTAFNKLFAESYGDVSNSTRTAGEDAAILGTVWDTVKEGAGSGLLGVFKSLTRAMSDGSDSAKSEAKAFETLKDIIGGVASAIVGGPWAEMISEMMGITNSVNNAIWSFVGLKNAMNDVKQTGASGDWVEDTPGKQGTKGDPFKNITPNDLQKRITGLKDQWDKESDADNRKYLDKQIATAQSLYDKMNGVKNTGGKTKTKTDKTDEASIELDAQKLIIDILKEKNKLTVADLETAKLSLIAKRDELQIAYDGATTLKEQFKIGKDLLAYTSAIHTFDKDRAELLNKALDINQKRLDVTKEIFDLEEKMSKWQQSEGHISPRFSSGVGNWNSPKHQSDLEGYTKDQNNKDGQGLWNSAKSTESSIKNIMNTLNVGSDTFVGKLLTGFEKVTSIVDDIANILSQAMGGKDGGFNLFGAIFGFITGGPAGAIGGATSGGGGGGGMTYSGGMPSGMDINKYRAIPAPSGGTVNHIHISGAMDGQTFLMKNIPGYNNTQNYITGS